MKAPRGLPERTPLEANRFERLTTHEEMVDFLRFLEASPRVRLDRLGTSTEGREIPYLKVSAGAFGEDEGRVTALIYAQQHGNEPAGKEGALAFALELARGDHDDALEHLDLLLVPQVNPDGGEAHRRRNAEGVDLNRSHLVLDGPEVEALRELFHRWEPEVAVDVHEYYPWSGAWLERGWLRLFDMQVGVPTNLNTDPAIRALAEEEFLAYAEARLADEGFTFHNYLVGSPDYLRWSTSNINDGRQGFAILNTLSFIFEGKRSEPGAEDIERRARAQRLAMESLLDFSAERSDEILTAVRGAREAVADGRVRDVTLVMDRERGDRPLEIPVEVAERRDGVDPDEVERPEQAWVASDTVTTTVESWYPVIAPRETVALPEGYLVGGEEEEILDLLARHRVEMRAVEEEAELTGTRLSVTGRRTVEIKGTDRSLLEVEARDDRLTARPGDVVVPTAQLRGLLVAVALEPGSMHGLWTYEAFAHLGEEGEYPVARVAGPPPP